MIECDFPYSKVYEVLFNIHDTLIIYQYSQYYNQPYDLRFNYTKYTCTSK